MSHPRSPLLVRPVTAADADLLLEWTNDPLTRAASFHPEPIDRFGHLRWLAARLSSPRTGFWIGEIEGVPVGQARVEVDERGVGEVSISVAPAARGAGTGRALLAAALGEARRTLPVTVFLARVRPENERSLALFRDAGFVPRGQEDGVAIPCLELWLG